LLFDALNKTWKNTRSYNQFLNVLKHAIKEGKKRELETLYKTSDEKNNSSKLHHNRHRSRTQRERKFSLKSAMNATEKALTNTSKFGQRRNRNILYIVIILIVLIILKVTNFLFYFILFYFFIFLRNVILKELIYLMLLNIILFYLCWFP